jgi:hypothetical protein
VQIKKEKEMYKASFIVVEDESGREWTEDTKVSNPIVAEDEIREIFVEFNTEENHRAKRNKNYPVKYRHLKQILKVYQVEDPPESYELVPDGEDEDDI